MHDGHPEIKTQAFTQIATEVLPLIPTHEFSSYMKQRDPFTVLHDVNIDFGSFSKKIDDFETRLQEITTRCFLARSQEGTLNNLGCMLFILPHTNKPSDINRSYALCLRDLGMLFGQNPNTSVCIESIENSQFITGTISTGENQLNLRNFIEVLRARNEYFRNTRRWQIPYPDSALWATFNSTQPIENRVLFAEIQAVIEIDKNDEKATHTITKGEQGELSYLRLVPTNSHPENQFNKSESSRYLLQSMEGSPWSEYGPSIDDDIRNVARNEQGDTPVAQNIAGLTDRVTFTLPNNGSSLEQTLSMLTDPSCKSSLNATQTIVLQNFEKALHEGSKMYVIERLFGDPALMIKNMIESAIISYEEGVGTWILQTNQRFYEVLTGLFGKNSFVQLSKTAQVKGKKGSKDQDTGLYTEFEEDECATYILDLYQAMNHIADQCEPGEPHNHFNAILTYVGSQLSIKAKLSAWRNISNSNFQKLRLSKDVPKVRDVVEA